MTNPNMVHGDFSPARRPLPRLLGALVAGLMLFACDRQEAKGPGGPVLPTAALVDGGALSGLDFPSNGQSSADIRFNFTGANLLPMYPATYIWRANLRQQAGYYALFYWGPNAPFYGVNYYGPRPYPDGSNKSASTSDKWAVSAYGQDLVTDANGHSTQLGFDAWRIQAFRAYDNGTNKVHEFYWDLPDTTKVIRQLVPRNYGSSPPSNAALTYGATPGDPYSQRFSGILRGIEVYKASLSLPDLLAESNDPMTTSAGSANIWYLNVNPTPGDISDKSGKGHNPAWVTSARPGVWNSSGTTPAPTVSLSANPASVASGSTTTLSWSSANATSCSASGGWSGSKAVNGSEASAALTANTTFTLTCSGAGGSASQSASVTVTSGSPVPTVTLSASPASVTSGSAATLTWSSANATSCAASGAWSGSQPVSGSQSTGALSATSTYTLTCTGPGGSASKSATVTVTAASGGAQTGMIFPSNDGNWNEIRFRFRGATLPPMYNVTFIWRLNSRQQPGYYTTFFWGPDGDYTGTSYYGCHPYPDGTGDLTQSTAHHWELSIDGTDNVSDVNGHNTQVNYGVWKVQAFRAWDDGTRKVHEFYWDLPDTTKVIRSYTSRSYGPPSNPAMTWGTSSWWPASEHLSGTLRGLQLYKTILTPAQILQETTSPLSTSAGSANIWYLNVNPTPDDISDKSGQGHHPEWVTELRPQLWTGP